MTFNALNRVCINISYLRGTIYMARLTDNVPVIIACTCGIVPGRLVLVLDCNEEGSEKGKKGSKLHCSTLFDACDSW